MSDVKSLRKEVIRMWKLVNSQHRKSLTALVHFDKDLAREILMIEERVDSSEHFIDSDCETYISLQAFQSVNIHFVMVVLKINRQLERIGDLAAQNASEILNTRSPFGQAMIEELKLIELYNLTNTILDLNLDAFESENESIVRTALGKSELFKNIALNVHKTVVSYIRNHPEDLNKALNLFSIIKNLEAVIDQTKLLADEIISYYEESVKISD